MRYSLALTLLAAALSAAAADNWPQFRGPHANGVADGPAPRTWGETQNVRWKTAIHDKGWSSPVIWGDQIWMTTARADGKELFAVCVDRKTGTIVHDLKVFTDPKPPFCIPYNSYASSTPVVEEGRVYVHFGSTGTACLDTATGKPLWERRDLPCNHFRGPGSSPILVGKLLILTFDGFDLNYLAALDKATGKTVWKQDRNIPYKTADGDFHKAYSTPAVLTLDGLTQLISPAAQATTAHDAATGKELWRVTHGGMNEAALPVHGHGLVFLTSGHTKELIAVRQGGSGDLTQDGIVWKVTKGVPTRPSLLLHQDWLFMVSDDGIVTCLEAKTGKQLWQERPEKNLKFSASPVLAGGHLYLTDEAEEGGKTFVLEAGPKYKLVATNKLAVGCMASPAVVGGQIFLRTRTHLYCIGE
jgi:outer membrane protein assembly factor BamB